MIIVMKKGAPKEASEKLKKSLEQRGFTIHDSIGESQEVLGIVGDTSILDPEDFMVNEWVDKAMRVQEPFKRANRMFHPEDSISQLRLSLNSLRNLKVVNLNLVSLASYLKIARVM